MFTVKSKAQFLSDVRALDESVKNVRLNSIEVERSNGLVRYNFICDKTVDSEVKNKILAEAEKITGQVFKTVQITVKKIACDSELICNEIFKYLNENYPSISIFLKLTDISCSEKDGQMRFVIRLTADGVEYVNRNGAIKKLSEYLSKNFCADFIGSCETKEVEDTVSLLSEEVYTDQLQKIEHRTIKVKEVVVIDDVTIGDTALYLEDASGEASVTVCGKITDVKEKETKTGKPMFVIHIDDTTGRISGVYFSKKSTLGMIRALKVGDDIIARGSFSDYNGRRSFTYDKINRCTFPEDFVKKDRFKKKAPKDYRLVFPSPASTVKISSVFDQAQGLPEELTSREYVVFDLETTGLELMSNGITEIGAVKIKNGKISEQFTTLVKPDYRIDAENFKITGISEEMVKDSPKIGEVMPDFIKFIEGAVLVAHNADFDMRFIKRFAGAEDFEIKNKVLDTMDLSRRYLPELRRNDLQTLADRFQVIFHHHRALSDAYATAEIFIELIKIKAQKGE